MYKVISGHKIYPVSYSFSQNASFDKRNKTARQIFIWLKIDRVIFFICPEIGKYTIYSKLRHNLHPRFEVPIDFIKSENIILLQLPLWQSQISGQNMNKIIFFFPLAKLATVPNSQWLSVVHHIHSYLYGLPDWAPKPEKNRSRWWGLTIGLCLDWMYPLIEVDQEYGQLCWTVPGISGLVILSLYTDYGLVSLGKEANVVDKLPIDLHPSSTPHNPHQNDRFG